MKGTLPGDPPGGRRALAVWGVGVSVYFVAVIFRTSLGVAGLDAADRFHVNASALSTFSILQLLVYAGMQIPVGLLVDRLGTKRVLGIGVVLFTAGQLGFARALARELGPAGVTVNSVAPGLIDTDITGGALEGERKTALLAGIPVGRNGRVDDVADLITYLCREETGYITGATYDVNGGSHIH